MFLFETYREGSQKEQVTYKSLQRVIKYHLDITDHRHSRSLEGKAVAVV